MEDEKIIELFFERSEQAIRELDRKYGKLCYSLSYSIVNSIEDAEECVNDAYLGAWNAIPPARPDPLLPYLCKIVRNLSLKTYYRKEAAKRSSHYTVAMEEIEACIADRKAVEDEVEAKELARSIEGFLDTLTAENRVIFFVLTNNNFLFGQDWMCTVAFAPSLPTDQDAPAALPSADADPELTAKIAEELRFYFESDPLDMEERTQLAEEYMESCRQLFGQLDGTVVPSVAPMELTLLDEDEKVLFDATVPADMQLQLTGLHRRTTDGYGKLLGSSLEESAMVLSAYVPQRKGQIDGGADLPLIYVFMYAVNDIESPQGSPAAGRGHPVGKAAASRIL